MRHLLPVIGLAVASLALGPAALADSSRPARREMHRPHPRVKRSPVGSVAIYIGRRLVWRASNRHVRVVSRVRWSRSRHALAFVTRNRRGAVTLEVVLMRGHTRGHNMSWPIPARLSRFRRAPSVTWLNERRVAFGRSAIRPDLVASWRVAK